LPAENASYVGSAPNGLNTADPEVPNALGDVISDLRAVKLSLGVPVGQVQFVEKNGTRYPIHGGTGDPNGDFNAIWDVWVDGKGLSQPDGGSSFATPTRPRCSPGRSG
jgi:acyl-homoserine-lactone acylase